MGIFGPFDCAYCGKHYRGLSWTIKGGKSVCGQCYDKFKKDFPDNKWQKMTASQLIGFYDEKEKLDRQPECSFCRRAFDESDIYKFVLKDKSKICYKCAESMRIAYPVFCTEEYDPYKGEFRPANDDPLLELTLKDIPPARQLAEKEREKRRAVYGDHKAVFIVDDVTRYYPKSGEEAHQIWGRAVLGRLDIGDRLCVKRREGPYYKEITWIDPKEYNKKAKSLYEGHDGALMILGDVSFIYPGDILTAD